MGRMINDNERIYLIKERLEQAKIEGNRLMIKIWSDILNKLTSKPPTK